MQTAMCGTDIAYADLSQASTQQGVPVCLTCPKGIALRAPYPMSGTHIGYPGTSLRRVRYSLCWLAHYRPTHVLRHVRY
eukprot:3725852-Rhodomonas_salina.1